MTDDHPDDGTRVPGETPNEVPGDRDRGNETPMPDGDDAAMPDGGTVPAPDTTSPTPTPTEVPRLGSAGTGARLSPDEIASNERGNGSLGTALALEMGGGGTTGSSTEDAMARAAKAQEGAGR